MAQHTMEYNGYLAIFEDPPTEEHIRQAREIMDRSPGYVCSGGIPLDPWPEDPTLGDPNGQVVCIEPIT